MTFPKPAYNYGLLQRRLTALHCKELICPSRRKISTVGGTTARSWNYWGHRFMKPTVYNNSQLDDLNLKSFFMSLGSQYIAIAFTHVLNDAKLHWLPTSRVTNDKGLWEVDIAEAIKSTYVCNDENLLYSSGKRVGHQSVLRIHKCTKLRKGEAPGIARTCHVYKLLSMRWKVFTASIVLRTR